MIRVLLLLLISSVASADTWSTSSGLSIGPSGVSVTTPTTGTLPEVTYKDGSPFAKEMPLREFLRKFTPATYLPASTA